MFKRKDRDEVDDLGRRQSGKKGLKVEMKGNYILIKRKEA